MLFEGERCERCGNETQEAFLVVLDGASHTFDCFACAIAALAPVCPRCGCRIVNRGVEQDDERFCSWRCARSEAPALPC